MEDHQADVRALIAHRQLTQRRALTELRPGVVVAEDVRARLHVPSVDNSQMDGFAVRAEDVRAGEAVTLVLGSPIPAGADPGVLEAGQARPIMTGSAIPAGADLVIPVEESAQGYFAPAFFSRATTSAETPATSAETLTPPSVAPIFPSVTLTPSSVEVGRFIRAAGSDTHAGDVIAREGTGLSAARIAHLASCGVEAVRVREPLRVLVVSTGSELVPAGTCADGQAHLGQDASAPRGIACDANGPGLAAALRAMGAEVVAVDRAPDDPEELVARIRAHARGTAIDLVVTSGGVSAGAYEPVRGAAELPGVSLSFVSVAMQPGGPQGLGEIEVGGVVAQHGTVGARPPAESTIPDGSPHRAETHAPTPAQRLAWIAFPGNPVSALLSAELFLRPMLAGTQRQTLKLPLRLENPKEPETSPEHLAQYRRARVLPSGDVRLVGGPSSHLLGALAGATALVRIPVGCGVVRDGDLLDTMLLPEGER